MALFQEGQLVAAMEGGLVHLVWTSDDHSPLPSHIAEGLGGHFQKVRPAGPQQLGLERDWIDEGAGQIHDGGHPQFQAGRHDILHGRVEVLGKEEDHARLVKDLAQVRWFHVQVDPQDFQDIGRTRLGGDGAIAMLGHLDAARSQNEGRRGGNIKTMGTTQAEIKIYPTVLAKMKIQVTEE